MVLLADQHIIGMVQLYAQRRGIKNAEALRRIVRAGLGLDPTGDKLDVRGKGKRDIRKAMSSSSLKPTSERVSIKSIPVQLREQFIALRKKVGSSEARRAVLADFEVKKRRNQTKGV